MSMNEKINKPLFESLGRPLYKGERLTPFYFDESATFPELIYMLNHYINQLVDRVNSYDEFAEEVMKLLKDIDAQIAEVTFNKLTEWYQDGSLQEMLQAVSDEYFEELGNELRQKLEELSEDINTRLSELETEFRNEFTALEDNLLNHPRYDTLNCVRVMRDINEARWSKATTGNGFNISGVQGGVAFKQHGTGAVKYTGAFTGFINSTEVVDGIQLVQYDSIGNVTTKRLANSYHTFGHGNGLTYDPDNDCFYMAVGSREGTGGNKVLFKISSDLDTYSSITLPFHTTDISYYNHNIYVIDDTDIYNMKVYTLNWDNEELTQICTFNPGISQAIYNFDIQNNTIFMVNKDNYQIMMFDLSTGSYLWTYKIPKFANNGHFVIAEVENITVFENGNIYIATHRRDGLQQSQCYVFEIFVCNYLTNKVSTSWIPTAIAETGGSVIEVEPHYVDGHASLKLQCQISNPNGTSSAPFETIPEAVEYINRNPHITHCKIRLHHHFAKFSAISSNKGITIYPDDYANNWNTGGFLLQDCSNISLFGLLNYNSASSEQGHGTQGAIWAVNSSLWLYECHLRKNEVASGFAIESQNALKVQNGCAYINTGGSSYVDGYECNVTGALYQLTPSTGTI